MKFTVKWEVEFYDHDKKLYCDIDEDDDNINNLAMLFESPFTDNCKQEGSTYNELAHKKK